MEQYGSRISKGPDIKDCSSLTQLSRRTASSVHPLVGGNVHKACKRQHPAQTTSLRQEDTNMKFTVSL